MPAKHHTDPVVTGCLRRISRGFIDAAFVLRDRLLETDHSLAEDLDALLADLHDLVTTRMAGTSRRQGVWANMSRDIGAAILMAVRDIARLFGRKWKLVTATPGYHERWPHTYARAWGEDGGRKLREEPRLARRRLGHFRTPVTPVSRRSTQFPRVFARHNRD
jgi:hypothetical protein